MDGESHVLTGRESTIALTNEEMRAVNEQFHFLDKLPLTSKAVITYSRLWKSYPDSVDDQVKVLQCRLQGLYWIPYFLDQMPPSNKRRKNRLHQRNSRRPRIVAAHSNWSTPPIKSSRPRGSRDSEFARHVYKEAAEDRSSV